MSDSSESTSSRHHHSAHGDNKEDKRSFWQRITEFISHGPESKQDLIEVLAGAEDKQVINAESRIMLEGVLRMAEMTVADVMVAAPRMDMLDIDATYEDLLNLVIETAHSRFPVYEDQRDNIIGILLAKDLLKLQRAPELNLKALLRPAMFVPESKGLNDLLREFRSHHNHQAIVIDEFGRVAGLVTIEDVLEEIVGEIEDEFDTEQDHGDIFGLADGTHRVSGDTPIEQFNESFEVALPVDEFDTVGGLVAHEMGHVPRRGEAFEIAGLRLVVMHTKGGAVRWFKVMALDDQDRDS